MTKRGVIIANGALQHPENARDAVRPDDLLIAADGGASHCRALGLTPAVIVGDLDSLSPQELASFERAGTQIIRHPAHKDYTDLELALLHARSLGLEQVLILGALGMRWDQTLANLLLPLSSELGGMEIRMLDGLQQITVIRSEAPAQIEGKVGDTVSLIPLCGDVHGVTTVGLEYPLEGDTLYFGATRGVSNVLVQVRAAVSLEEGVLLCVVIHKGDDS